MRDDDCKDSPALIDFNGAVTAVKLIGLKFCYLSNVFAFIVNNCHGGCPICML